MDSHAKKNWSIYKKIKKIRLDLNGKKIRRTYKKIDKILLDKSMAEVANESIFLEFIEQDEMLSLDVYYNSICHPKFIHDEFGSEGLSKFELMLIKEILSRNKAKKIWHMSSFTYAIIHKDTNCDSFELNFRGLQNTILKKTIDLIIR